LADVCDLGAHLEHDPLDAAPDRKIATRRTAPLPVNDPAPMKNCDSVLRERPMPTQKNREKIGTLGQSGH
jgi:hypothetical protein